MTVEQLGDQARKFIAAARQRPELGNVFTSFDPNYPQVKVELDREKARTLGVPVNEVFQTMSTAMGGAFVNDFNRFGRLYRVYVQAESEDRLKSRRHRKDLRPLEDHESDGPAFDAGNIKDIAGTELTTRFNLLRSVELQGAPARGYTSGQALAALEEVFARDNAEGDEFRVLVAVVSGEDRAAARADFHYGDRLRLPVARRDVRELATAVGRAAGIAAGCVGRVSSASGCLVTTTTSTCRSVS